LQMADLIKDKLFSKQSNFKERKYCPLHYHNEIELYYLLKGRIKYFVDNKTYFLNEGDLIIIPKQILHSTDSEDCLYNERLLLNFNTKHYYSDISSILQGLFEENIIHIAKENQSVIENMFYKIESEYLKNNKCSDQLIRLYISELIIYLSRYKIMTSSSNQDTDLLMQKIAEYINLNYDKDLSLKTLSKKFNLSESYISKRFKMAIGTCINEYINYVRITRAEELLKTEKLPMTEICYKCGFNDSSYFSSVFKKLKGITPYKFKKSMQNKRTI